MSDPSWVLIVAVFLISRWIALLAHEAGHFLFARLAGMPVISFMVGQGPDLFSRKIKDTFFRIRLLPVGGLVTFVWPLVPGKSLQLLVMLGGVIANIILILIFEILAFYGALQHIPASLSVAIFFGLIISMLSIVPFVGQVNGQRQESDGLQALRILFRRRGEMSSSAVAYLQMIRRYMPDSDLEALKSPNGPRIIRLFIQTEIFEGANPQEKVEEFQQMLKDGALSPAEEVLVLDALVTKALLNREPALLAQIDEWSSRSLTLAPGNQPLLATRGGVLAELGRYRDAKALLEPIAQTTTDPYERMMCLLFQACAEFALDDEKATFRSLWELRRAIGDQKLSEVALARIMEIEAKASKKWPVLNSEERQIFAA